MTEYTTVNHAEYEATLSRGAFGTREKPREEAKPNQKRGRMDIPFLVLSMMLLTIGVIMVLSASFARSYLMGNGAGAVFFNQFRFALFGIAAMLLLTRVPTHIYRRFAVIAMIGSIVLLFAVFIPKIGVSHGGARRWIKVGIEFQPSELTKIGLILGFSYLFCVRKRPRNKIKIFELRTWRARIFALLFRVFSNTNIQITLIAGVAAAILLKQPHLSAAIIIVGIAAIIMFRGGLKIRWVTLWVAILAVLVVVVVQYVEREFQAGRLEGLNYQLMRIVSWLHPEADPQGGGYQILQSLYAIGSGGAFGVGIGQSRQKYLYLPEEHNDYIFAIVCEELGFVGAFLIIALFALLIIRGFWLAIHAKDKFSSLVVTGITGMLAIQVFLNISVVTNFLPCTGISLPFFSYGGTALVIQLAEIGIILGISRDITNKKAG